MHGNARGRLTVPDVAFLLMSLAFLRVLWPIMNEAMLDNLGELNTSTAWLVRLILPLAILILFSMLWLKATSGVAR